MFDSPFLAMVKIVTLVSATFRVNVIAQAVTQRKGVGSVDWGHE